MMYRVKQRYGPRAWTQIVTHLRGPLRLIFILGLVTPGPVAQSAPRLSVPMTVEQIGEALKLEVGRSMVIQTPWTIKRISVAEPIIADVQVIDPNQIVVLGKSIGLTDLIVWSEDTEVWAVQIHVELDLETLNAELAEFFPGTSLGVSVSKPLGVYVVRGMLERAEQIERLHEFLDLAGIKYVDMTRLAGLQQVQLKVRVAEVNRRAIRNLSINTFYDGGDFFGDITLPLGGASNVLLGFPGADLEFLISALKENQYLQILAEPTLVALSGEEASFLAGGEFPIPVVQGGGGGSQGDSGTGQGTSITIEFKEFGIGLRFTPTVLGGGVIRLHVAPEVSELSDIGAITVQGFTIPSLITRRVETTVELKSGQTFVMAGLLNQTIDARNSRLPLLGDLPILGPLFRSVSYQMGESELVVLVTASLVEPLSHSVNRPLPGELYVPPDDWELFFQGRLEGRIWETSSSADGAGINLMGFKELQGPGAWATYHRGASVKPSYMKPGSMSLVSGNAATAEASQ